MIQKDTLSFTPAADVIPAERNKLRKRLSTFPWWLVAMFLIAAATVWQISTRESYRDAFLFIKAGLVSNHYHHPDRLCDFNADWTDNQFGKSIQ